MKTNFPGLIAVVVATLITVGMPFSSAAVQGFSGCPAGGVAPPAAYYLPHLWNDFLVVSDERRNAEQLAATFADPTDARARLDAYCWTGQAERVYARGALTVDVSVHTFLGVEGATLAHRWFGEHRAQDLGLKREVTTRDQLEQALGPINVEALDNISINAFHNETEYALYARRNDLVARVSVSGDPAVSGRSQQIVAYQVLALVFGVDLFSYPRSIP